ncbi:glycosyltransferase family 1 protein [Leptolyngbya sp. FACHB-321]|uniref:glycosyltransferase family 4 protein n=1 Tax=Leptolyngbya sp. FACHB-321 TaxID=2692807 RepID=UPI001F54BC8C|nr:glycosyltransferase family 1 protein [Leptolyngbya sp. FACHB-321]
MDVYADGIVNGLKAVRPDWDIVELVPPIASTKGKSWLVGLQKYYQRYWSFPSTVRQQDVDLFHIIDHSDGHLAYWLQGAHKPIVVTCHDLINFLQPENISDQAKLPLLSAAVWKYAVKGIRHADHIVTVSAHTAKDVIRLMTVEAERLTVAPNAVEALFQPLPPSEFAWVRQQQQISSETTCLLNVGSNHPRKNVAAVLSALNTLKDQGVSVHLFKTGADFTAEQKTFIQSHNLKSFVTYLGKPDKTALIQIYNAADILVAPSLYEGFGMTILEAMACGTPVVTSNVTSLPEVAGDAAIVVAPNDIAAIVQAVDQLREDDNLRHLLIEKGLVRVKSFTWEKTSELIADIYEQLLDKAP